MELLLVAGIITILIAMFLAIFIETPPKPMIDEINAEIISFNEIKKKAIIKIRTNNCSFIKNIEIPEKELTRFKDRKNLPIKLISYYLLGFRSRGKWDCTEVYLGEHFLGYIKRKNYSEEIREKMKHKD